MLKKLIISFLLLLTLSATAAEEDFKILLEPSGPYALLTFELTPTTKVYWRHPGEIGLPTKIKFNGSSNLKSAQVLWPLPTLDTEYNLSSYVYRQEVNLPIKIVPEDKTKPVNLKIQVNFTICKKSCSNHDVDLSIILNPNSAINEKTLNALSKIPHTSNDNIAIGGLEQKIVDNQHWLLFKVTSKSALKNPKIFLELPEYARFEPNKDIIINLNKPNKNEYVVKIPFSLNKSKQHLEYAYLNLATVDGEIVEYEFIAESMNQYSFMLILFYALLGGLILNVMPCVLPILAQKVLQIAKVCGKDSKLIRYDLLAQALGIIFSFTIVALTTYFLQQIGTQVGFGMHFQQPAYIITMTIILSLIAINLLTKPEFHFPIPHFIARLIPLEQKGILGFFFTGILSTLLAIPCTAPFVTVAVGFALTTDFVKMFAIFSCIGIGMALPYIILAVTPKIDKLLPKPGIWMNQLKRLLGIMILATSLWLIYIIYTQLGFKAAISLFLLVILIKFILTEKFLDKKFKILIFIILVSLCYVIPFHLHQEITQEESIIEDVWKEYNHNQIGELIKNGHVVLLDVTASWCSTCSVNKFTTINNIVVMEFMRKNNIIGMRADISASTPPQIFNLMKMHNHHGIPLNIIYSKTFPEGLVLPTILLPSILISNIKKAGNF